MSAFLDRTKDSTGIADKGQYCCENNYQPTSVLLALSLEKRFSATGRSFSSCGLNFLPIVTVSGLTANHWS